MNAPQYGDVIFAKRSIYNHYGIYVSDDEVIHYCKKSNGIIENIKNTITCDGIITDTSYKVFHEGDPVYICRFNELTINTLIFYSLLNNRVSFWDLLLDLFPITAFLRRIYKKYKNTYTEEHRASHKVLSPEETVKIARQSRGEKNYSLWGNNCEHFAIWCKTGVKDCAQKEKIKKILEEEFAQKSDH